MIRRILFQVHMWIGLVLGVLFVALGLSGSVLVYHEELDGLSAPPPRASATGVPQPLDAVLAAARQTAPDAKGNVFLTLPQEPGDPAMIRFLPAQRDGAGRGAARRPQQSATVFVDPVSAKAIGTRASAMSPLVQFAHDLHGGLLLGRDGRPLVGWLGIGMVILGLTGLVLWWPKPHLWKYAFLVRRTARGLRFHRELHAAVGIWGFVVFILVSFTGVGIAFPETLRAATGGGATPAFNLRTGPEVEPVHGAPRIGADEAVRVALAAVPGGVPRSVMLPGRKTQAISVALASTAGRTPLQTMVYVDPYRATVMAVRDPGSLSFADGFVAWQRPVHDGDPLLGPVWRFLVFLSGFLPLVFVVTGVTMWIKKRRAHIAMDAPLAEGAAP
ncbi:MAG: PepSY-associated TM helix domain-containing protein [Rhizomicrobium sp.]